MIRASARKPISGAVAPPKPALVAYWKRVAKQALPHLKRRLLKLVRHEDGIVFYHEGAGALPQIPEGVHPLTILKREGGEAVRVWIDSLPGLLGLVEMDVVEIHPWGATIDDIERPDLLVFDLHPGAGADWQRVSESALELREALSKEGLDSWPKLGGENDLHIMVPFDRSLEWDAARVYCKLLAREFAEAAPARYTTESGPANRINKVYIDYLRNGRGSTAIGTYSPIAHPGFPIAAPLTWAQVENGVRPEAFTMDQPIRVGLRRTS
jgi:bifunctional non-homologous end joining protein LigD